jgi:ATP-binding cassette subfamily F protein 3
MLVADEKLAVFEGDLNEYQQWLLDFRKQQTANNTPENNKTELSRKEQRQQDARQREARRPLLQKIKRLEDQLEKLQRDAAAIETALTDLSLYETQNKEKLQQFLLNQAKLKKEIEEVEEAWLIACEERDIT